jgi:hypothetical protein
MGTSMSSSAAMVPTLLSIRAIPIQAVTSTAIFEEFHQDLLRTLLAVESRS